MLGLPSLYCVASYSHVTFAGCWEVFQTKLKDRGVRKSLKGNPCFQGLVWKWNKI